MIKNRFFRKSITGLKQVPRKFYSSIAHDEDYVEYPPILCNSFPKSGSHLLSSILSVIPGVKNFGTVTNSLTSFFDSIPTTKEDIQYQLTHLAPGEIAVGHLFHDTTYIPILQSKNVVNYFIYRDLRDVIISEAYDIAFTHSWHKLHKYFKLLRDMEERIAFTIDGTTSNFSYSYPNIYQRFQSYKNWMVDKNIFLIRFEDLLGEKRVTTVSQIVDFYLSRTSRKLDRTEIINQALKIIDSKNVHLFMQNKVSIWRQKLSTRQKQHFAEIAGDLLVELGYEANQKWISS